MKNFTDRSIGQLSRASISIDLKPNVEIKSLNEVIERISKLSGCTGCGLLGFDLHFHGVDPLEAGLQDIPGINKTTVTIG